MNLNTRHNKIEMRASDTERENYRQLGIVLDEPFSTVLRRLANREVQRHGIGGDGPKESRHCPGVGKKVASRASVGIGRMRRQV